MNRDREYLINTMCRQIMGMSEPDGSTPRSTTGIENAASATVNLELSGMVMNMRRQIWIDTSAWTAKIVAEIERQANEINLDEEIAKAVRTEVNRVLADIANTAKKHVTAMVTEQVRERLAKFPDRLAAKLASTVWDKAWKAKDE